MATFLKRAKHKNTKNPARAVGFVFLGLSGLVLLLAVLLHGTDVALLHPKGFVAEQQTRLIVFCIILLLTIAIPSLLLLYFFAWEFRDSNQHATHDPNAQHGKLFAFSLWVIPVIVVTILASVMLPAAHKLDQHKSIAANVQPLTIKVIALRWKWLFIYPDQNISTVNYVHIPVGTPVKFDLTADETPMSSFWIPHLGGQLYAMTGHSNQLNLVADYPGEYRGSSAEINGAGFAGMKFTVVASSGTDFDQWVDGMQKSPRALGSEEYKKLLEPSENNSAAFYTLADPGLYDTVLMKYMGSHQHNAGSE